jgi:hypothetical protein
MDLSKLFDKGLFRFEHSHLLLVAFPARVAYLLRVSHPSLGSACVSSALDVRLTRLQYHLLQV